MAGAALMCFDDVPAQQDLWPRKLMYERSSRQVRPLLTAFVSPGFDASSTRETQYKRSSLLGGYESRGDPREEGSTWDWSLAWTERNTGGSFMELRWMICP